MRNNRQGTKDKADGRPSNPRGRVLAACRKQEEEILRRIVTMRSWRSLRRIGFWYTGSAVQSFDFPEETSDFAIKNGLRGSFRNWNVYKQGFELLTFLCIPYVIKQSCTRWGVTLLLVVPTHTQPLSNSWKKFLILCWVDCVWDGFVDDNVERATWEACSVTWNLATNSEFALGLGKTAENVRWLAGRRTFRILIT